MHMHGAPAGGQPESASVPDQCMCRASKRHKPADEQPAEEQQPASPPVAPWTVDVVQTPSGRALRGVQGWLDSGIELSCVSDQAARLLDMAAEQILGVFGDPYGGPPAASPPHNAPTATGKGATATHGSRAQARARVRSSAGTLWFGVMLRWCKPLMPPRLCAGCAAEAMKADPDCAVPPCVMLWLRLLGSSGKRGEQDVKDLLQCAKRALDIRPHTLREHAVRLEPSTEP